jgi:isopentenyl diphosphate isomerase/L-lactate dehydrogenase-like FMN-dependent dehydrogenase
MPFTQTLTAPQAARAWKRLVDAHLAPAGPVTLTKAELVAAANALQAYLWDNRSAINTALPVAARTALNTDQKMALLAVVALVNLEG